MIRNLQARAQRNYPMDGISIYLFEKLSHGEISIMTNAEFTTINPDKEPYPDDFHLTFSVDTAQQLMDNLWFCGLRPTEGSGSAGAMQAVENHLKDLRTETDRLFELLKQEVCK